jgi:hypothetical protein
MGHDRRQKGQKPKTERVVIGNSDAFLRERTNLLTNIEVGYGKVRPYGKHVMFTVGSEQFGYVEYLLLDTVLPEHVMADRRLNKQ